MEYKIKSEWKEVKKTGIPVFFDCRPHGDTYKLLSLYSYIRARKTLIDLEVGRIDILLDISKLFKKARI